MAHQKNRRKKIMGLAILVAAIFLSIPSTTAAADAEWEVETVDSEGLAGCVASLALDSNDNPHISYYDGSDLKYAWWDGSWDVTTADSGVFKYTSLALDSNDNAHISYTSNHLHYAWWDGSWDVTTAEQEHPRDTSLALDSNDNPHISYYNGLTLDLHYAKWDGSWDVITVASEGSIVDTSLALDSNDNPHISYYTENDDLKYAWWDGSWHTSTVDSEGIGYDTSLALDSNDNPHISYHDSKNSDLKYAWWDGSWHTSTVDSEGMVGEEVSLALDSNDKPHIGYYNNTNDDLKYAYSELNEVPTADFTYSPGSPVAGGSVEFDASASSDPDGSIVSYKWDLDGDGVFDETTASSTVTHTYEVIGNYNVKLSVEDDDGNFDTVTKEITVVEANSAPELTDGSVSPSKDEWGNPFNFYVFYQDSDGDAPTVKVVIDGVGYEMDKVGGTYEGGATYKYQWVPGPEDVGTLDYSFSASDGAHKVYLPSEGGFEVEVEQCPPIAYYSFTTSELTLDFMDESSDKDGSIVSWEWDLDGDGTIDTTKQNPSHTYQSSGTYTVSLTVTDSQGSSDTKSMEVTLGGSNGPPTADFTYDTDGLTVDFVDRSMDPDGSNDLTDWSWDFGDGQEDNAQGPSHTYSSEGTYTVKLIVEDSEGVTDSLSKQVTVQEAEEGTPTVEPEEDDVASGDETFTLDTVSRGEGSVSVSPSKESYEEGTEVTLTAESASGYKFDHWTGDVSGESNPITVTIDSDTRIYALFIPSDEDQSTTSASTSTTSNVGPRESESSPGFEILFAIGGLLAATYVIRKSRK